MNKHHFTCNYCEHKFVREDRYIAHQCKQMRRYQDLQTPIGQTAWNTYQKWMRAHKRMVPSPKVFLTSKYFQSFLRFAEHAKRVNLPDLDSFIELMKELDVTPTLWTNDQIYAAYLENLDRHASPKRQAEITVKTIMDLAELGECEPAEVFNVVDANTVIQLIRERRLSPWLLLFSKTFKQLLTTRATPEQQLILESIIRPKYWAEKFAKQTDDVKRMKLYVKELKI